jgi:hypothetical protein
MLDAEQSCEFTQDLNMVQTPSAQCCPVPQSVSVAHCSQTWSIGSQRSLLPQSMFDAHIAPGVVDIPLDELLDACVPEVLEVLAVWPPIPDAVPLVLVVVLPPPCPTAPVPVAAAWWPQPVAAKEPTAKTPIAKGASELHRVDTCFIESSCKNAAAH